MQRVLAWLSEGEAGLLGREWSGYVLLVLTRCRNRLSGSNARSMSWLQTRTGSLSLLGGVLFSGNQPNLIVDLS